MHHEVFVRTPIVKSSSVRFRKFIGATAVFLSFESPSYRFIYNKLEQFCDGFILMWHNHFNSISIKHQCPKKLSFLKTLGFQSKKVSILTRFSCKVIFSKIKKYVIYLLRVITDVDLHFSKTPSKSCFCYLIKFLTGVLYLSFCSFF